MDWRHIATIARLSLSEDELERISKDAEEIFKLLERVSRFVGDEEIEQMEDEYMQPREDQVSRGEEVLFTFPRVRDRFVVVPKNLGD